MAHLIGDYDEIYTFLGLKKSTSGNAVKKRLRKNQHPRGDFMRVLLVLDCVGFTDIEKNGQKH